MTEPERRSLRALIDARRREVTGALADGLLHGTAMSYRKGRCRCGVCQAYAAGEKRRWRHANPERARAETSAYKKRRRARALA